MRLFVQEAAEQDVLRQVEWYAEQGLPEVAQRFSAGVAASLKRLVDVPEIGSLRPTANPKLAGLRAWPVTGFEALRVYYLLQPNLLIVLRILHGRQDGNTILEQHSVRDDGAD